MSKYYFFYNKLYSLWDFTVDKSSVRKPFRDILSPPHLEGSSPYSHSTYDPWVDGEYERYKKFRTPCYKVKSPRKFPFIKGVGQLHISPKMIRSHDVFNSLESHAPYHMMNSHVFGAKLEGEKCDGLGRNSQVNYSEKHYYTPYTLTRPINFKGYIDNKCVAHGKVFFDLFHSGIAAVRVVISPTVGNTLREASELTSIEKFENYFGIKKWISRAGKLPASSIGALVIDKACESIFFGQRPQPKFIRSHSTVSITGWSDNVDERAARIIFPNSSFFIREETNFFNPNEFDGNQNYVVLDKRVCVINRSDKRREKYKAGVELPQYNLVKEKYEDEGEELTISSFGVQISQISVLLNGVTRIPASV